MQSASHEAPHTAEYFPAGQLSHDSALVAPSANEYFPAAHCWHASSDVAITSVENFPCVHRMHNVSDQAPTVVEYRPSPHARHSSSYAAPNVVEYFPTAQFKQVSFEAPPVCVEYLPGTQSKQKLDPGESEYLPLPHVLQSVGYRPPITLPFSKRTGIYFPGAQSVHESGDCAVLCMEYLPIGQFVHSKDPTTSLYLPASHCAHGPPSGP